jgi:predicted alpha/beta-hydrolase family hydrolase
MVQTADTVDWKVAVEDETVTARFEHAATPRSIATFVCAHGAGGHMDDRGMAQVAGVLRERGLNVARFNFPYRERESSRPDSMSRLTATIAAVVTRVRSRSGGDPLIIGGRSMGGRAASMLAADGFDCDGVILLAYPLHPAGRPEQLRDAHLPNIRVPVLCLTGTRDALCTRALMEAAVARVRTPWLMHWLAGADHGFHVLKSSGRTDADVLTEVADVTARWIPTVGARRGA